MVIITKQKGIETISMPWLVIVWLVKNSRAK
jgi:hypothetical protein